MKFTELNKEQQERIDKFWNPTILDDLLNNNTYPKIVMENILCMVGMLDDKEFFDESSKYNLIGFSTLKEKEAGVSFAKNLNKPFENVSEDTLDKVESMFKKSKEIKKDSLSIGIRNQKEADDFMRQLNSLTPKREYKGCPCLYLDNPCHERCTCVNHFSSVGCQNCCTYGSIEQRRAKAIQLNDIRLSN